MIKLFITPAVLLAWAVGASFENTIQTGQILLGVILSIGTIAGIVYGIRYRTAYEVQTKVSEGLQDLFDMKDAESKVLHDQLLETKDLIAKQTETIARLEQLPNLERILHYMGEMSVRQDAQAEKRVELALKKIEGHWLRHDTRAEERAQRIILALQAREGDTGE